MSSERKSWKTRKHLSRSNWKLNADYCETVWRVEKIKCKRTSNQKEPQRRTESAPFEWAARRPPTQPPSKSKSDAEWRCSLWKRTRRDPLSWDPRTVWPTSKTEAQSKLQRESNFGNDSFVRFRWTRLPTRRREHTKTSESTKVHRKPNSFPLCFTLAVILLRMNSRFIFVPFSICIFWRVGLPNLRRRRTRKLRRWANSNWNCSRKLLSRSRTSTALCTLGVTHRWVQSRIDECCKAKGIWELWWDANQWKEHFGPSAESKHIFGKWAKSLNP